MRRMVVMLVAVLAFMASGAVATAQEPGGATPPTCDGKTCPPEEPKPPEEVDECPPADGPISGIVQGISDGIRGAGGGSLADVIDEINCGLIVGVLHLRAPAAAR
jgi:hypothetical protein